MNLFLYLLPVAFVSATLDVVPTHQQKSSNQFTSTYYAPARDFFRFGDQLLVLERYNTGSVAQSYLLVSMHGNEVAAVRSTRSFAQEHGISYVVLRNQSAYLLQSASVEQGSVQQNVVASLRDRQVQFDPEKIFTSWGRRVNLKQQRNLNGRTVRRVEQLAKFVTSELEGSGTIVTVHNAEIGSAGIVDFSKRSKEVDQLYQNTVKDVSEYVVTNDVRVFEGVKARGLNVVLLKRGKVEDDGSLGVYCSKTDRSYTRIEAGREEVRVAMLGVVDAILRK